MKLNKKLQIAIVCLVSIPVLGFFFMNVDDTEQKTSPDQVIKNIKTRILSDIEESNDLTYESIRITHLSSKYARARIEERSLDLFLVYINNDWKSAFVTDEPVFCEKAVKIGFPANFIEDCVLEYPGTIDLSEYLNNDNQEVSQVIVDLASSQDPFCDCLIAIIDDEELSIPYAGDTSDLDSGDTVVIEIENGEVQDIIDVIDENLNDSDDGDDSSSKTIYINPDPEISQEGINLYFLDIDMSGQEIQLITDL
jgi:hypothetical protein